MKPNVVLEVLAVLVSLVTCITCPAFADGATAIVVRPAPVVVQAQPAAVVVQAQPAPVVVQAQPVVVVEPYTVLEEGVSVQIDPEDYYYMDKDVYYHHEYQTSSDVVVKVVPTGHTFLHSRIDISTVPQKHFHHQALSREEKKELKKEEKRDR